MPTLPPPINPEPRDGRKTVRGLSLLLRALNKPKTHDNAAALAFVADYPRASDLCEVFPLADDIFSGVLAARTAGNTATRTLSRQTLYHIISVCPVISVESINGATGGQLATSTLQAYAAAARVLSRALAGLVDQTSADCQPLPTQQWSPRVDLRHAVSPQAVA